MIARKEIETYPIGEYAIKEMDKYLHCIPGVKFTFPNECEYLYFQSKSQTSSTKKLYEYITIIPNNLSNSIKQNLKRELDLQDLLKKSSKECKISSSRTPYNLGRKFSSLNTVSVTNYLQNPSFLQNTSNIASTHADISDNERYMSMLHTKSTKELLKSSCSAASIAKPKVNSTKHSCSKAIKFPKATELENGKKDLSVMSQYKEPEMSFNYSINNKSRINEIDEKIIKMDIGDEHDEFQVQQEIELTKKELQKLDEIRSQLIWVDRERIKRRLGLWYRN